MGSIEVAKNYISDTAWHEIGAGGEPAFTNSWVNHSAGTWDTAGYRIDQEGWVHLKGLVKDGTIGSGNGIFTLPVGYRPMRNFYCTGISNDYPCYLFITSSGVVSADSVGGSNAFVSLNNVKFPAWSSWDQFTPDKYQILSTPQIEGRNTDSEFPIGIWPRKSGMVELSGIGGIVTTAGTGTGNMLNGYLPYFTQMFGVMHAGTAGKRLDVGSRLGLLGQEITTTYTLVSAEYGLPHIEGNWIDMSLVNSWANFGYNSTNRHGKAQYWKDSDGFVHLRGLVKNGSSATATITTLPAGYRPAARQMHMTLSSSGVAACRIDVQVDGTVNSGAGGATGWISMDGVCFYADV